MKEVDIEGVKIQLKNLTLFIWSTRVKSQELVYLNKNETYYKFNSVSYTHFQVKKVNIDSC